MEEKKTSVTIITMGYGAILGIILIVFSLILFLLDQSMNRGLSWISFVFLLGGIIFAQLTYRKKYLDGYMTFGKAFMVGFLTVIFAAILSGIYSYVYFVYIDPGAVEQIMAESEKGMMDQGMSDIQIDQGLEMMRIFQSPFMLTITGIVMNVIIGAILSLLSAIFTKKESSNVIPMA